MFDPCTAAMAVSPSLSGGEKKHWWLSNRKLVEKYVREAKILIATQEQSEIASALSLLEAALSLSPRYEQALELKARCLLYLRQFKDVAEMLQDYIPSLRMAYSSSDETSSTTSSSSSDNSSSQLSKERVKLLSSSGGGDDEPVFKCFSVSDLKKKVMAGLCKNGDKEGHWRYLVLGQACCHLGLMEDAMVLLQTGKRLATAAFRRESNGLSDDSFSFSSFSLVAATNNQPPPKTEADSISQLLCHIKLLLRRKTAAIAALDAGLYSEAIRHFSKIVDGRRGAPRGFLAECFLHRASGYRSAGRIAEAIADCNRTLALNPSCIEALHTRAALFETIRCLPDSLHDLEHLKLLYNTMLRDRKLPGPAWKRQYVQYREIPGKLCSLAAKIQELKQRVASGETGNVDYYALIGLRRGCTRSELERAHLLLTIRHKPDKSTSFIERCEFADEHDADSVRDRSRMSALLLYRLIQKGYTSLMMTIMEEEPAEKQRKKAAASLQAAAAAQAMQVQQQSAPEPQPKVEKPIEVSPLASKKRTTVNNKVAAITTTTTTTTTTTLTMASPSVFEGDQRVEKKASSNANTNAAGTSSVFQGVFCRDLAIVGSLLSQVGFNRPLPLKYEALSC